MSPRIPTGRTDCVRVVTFIVKPVRVIVTSTCMGWSMGGWSGCAAFHVSATMLSKSRVGCGVNATVLRLPRLRPSRARCFATTGVLTVSRQVLRVIGLFSDRCIL
jgi:hypothetical protein